MLMAPLYGRSPHKWSGGGLVIKSFLTLGSQWTIARHYNPLSMGYSRQEYWGTLPFLTPGDPPDLGIEPRSPGLQVDSLLTEPPGYISFFYKECINKLVQNPVHQE